MTELYSIVQDLQFHTTILQVTWQKHEGGFVKINSDGSSLSNLGKIGIGVIVRDSEGNLIHALAKP